jgi:uncharacterized membrane protein YkvI
VIGRLLEGRFGALVLPGIVLQSVLVGGGYATGREVVAYGAKHGPVGWLSVAAIFVGFTVMSALTFEVARVFGAYEYKGFVQRIIGRAWPVFDVLFGLMAVLVVAVMASAAASIMETTLGVPSLAGTTAIVAAVGVLSYLGSRSIEAFKSVGTLALYGAYVLFAVLVLADRGDAAVSVLSGTAPAPDAVGVAAGAVAEAVAPDAGPAAALGSGVLYVGYNLVVFPAVLFALRRQSTRRETMTAAVVAGALMTVPFALTWLCLLAFYPSPEVLDAPVPWLPMLETVGGPWVVVVFGVVMGWTLLETSVGLIHALLDRVDRDLRERAGGERASGDDDAPGPRPGGVGPGRASPGTPSSAGYATDAEPTPSSDDAADPGLSRLQSGLLGAGILVAAALLSRVGIIALVARGYTVMGYLLIAVFAVPLLTVGALRVFRPDLAARLFPGGVDAGTGR